MTLFLMKVAMAATCVAGLLSGHLIADPLFASLGLGLRLSVKVVGFQVTHGLPVPLSNLLSLFTKYTPGSILSPPLSDRLVRVENVLNEVRRSNTTHIASEHAPNQWDSIHVWEIDPKGFFHLGDDGVLRSFDRNEQVIAYWRLTPTEIRQNIARFVKTYRDRNTSKNDQDIHEAVLSKHLHEVYEGVDGRDVIDPMDLWFPRGRSVPLQSSVVDWKERDDGAVGSCW